MGGKSFCWKMNEFPQKPYHEWEGLQIWSIKLYAKTIDSILDLLAFLAMLLIFAIGLVVRDTLLQTTALFLVLAGLFLFIQWLKKSYTNKCNTLLHVDLDLAFLAAIPSVEQECEKAHFTD